MIRVWVSNRLERLAGRLVRSLESDEGGVGGRGGFGSGSGVGAGLFARPQVVVPNEQIATYLKYEVARTAGIAAGLALPVLEQFHEWLLEEHLPGALPPYRLVSQATLRTLFLGVLSESAPDRDPAPLPQPVRDYLDAADDPSSRDLRRFQLATRLARLARQYGDTCPELLRAWAAGETSLGPGDGPLAETEGWQRALWARVIGPGGPLDRARAEGRWNWILPASLFRVLDRADGYEPPEVVHIFGFSYLWTGLCELLEHLGRTSEVHVYVLSPWQWSAVPPVDAQNALLAWGQPGVDFMRMVAGLHAGVTQLFVASAPARALGRLQNEILEGKGPGPEPYRHDDSIQVLACASIRREAEAIAGEIWRRIREGPRRSAASKTTSPCWSRWRSATWLWTRRTRGGTGPRRGRGWGSRSWPATGAATRPCGGSRPSRTRAGPGRAGGRTRRTPRHRPPRRHRRRRAPPRPRPRPRPAPAARSRARPVRRRRPKPFWNRPGTTARVPKPGAWGRSRNGKPPVAFPLRAPTPGTPGLVPRRKVLPSLVLRRRTRTKSLRSGAQSKPFGRRRRRTFLPRTRRAGARSTRRSRRSAE